MINNEYYLYLYCSEDHETICMDANASGWEMLKKILQEMLMEVRQQSEPISKILGLDVLSLYSSGDEYTSVEQLTIRLDNSLVNYSNEIHFHLSAFCSDKKKSCIILANIEGLMDLISSITCLIEHKGKFPTDISHMVPEWGGGNLILGTHISEYKAVSHLRLYRWK